MGHFSSFSVDSTAAYTYIRLQATLHVYDACLVSTRVPRVLLPSEPYTRSSPTSTHTEETN